VVVERVPWHALLGSRELNDYLTWDVNVRVGDRTVQGARVGCKASVLL